MEKLLVDEKASVQKWQRCLEEVSKELVTIQTMLQDAEERQLRDERVKRWLHALKDAVFDFDDLIDEWNSRQATQGKVRLFDRTCFSWFRRFKVFHEIGRSLQIFSQMKKKRRQ